jgi:thiol-disulfide isomerase/thioredoxin
MSGHRESFHLRRGVLQRTAGCLLVAGLLAVAPAGARDKEPLLKAGDVPPDRLGTVKLSDYRGRVVVVTFWASWCPPCRKELPILAGIQAQVTTDRLQVLAVNWGENYDRFQQIVRVLKPVLKDAPIKLISDENQRYGNQYGVHSIPHMVIIGPDGRIVAVHLGYGEDEVPVVVNELNRLLAASAAAGSTPGTGAASSELPPAPAPAPGAASPGQPPDHP